MNRRIVSIIVLALSLSLFGAILHFIGQNERLEHYYVSDDEWSEIISTRVRSEDMNTDFLRFNHENLFRTNDDVLFYSMIDDDVHAYNPKVQISGGLKIAVKGEHLSAEMVEQNQQLDLMIYNNDVYQVFKLTTTNLPLLSIDYETGEAPLSRQDVEFSLKLYDNRSNVVNRVIQSDGESHRRGASSFYTDKPSLSLKLTSESLGNNTRSNPMSLLGMRESSHWVLKSMYYDYERFRDYFAAKLWSTGSAESNSFDIDNSIDFKYVEVIENGEYSGLYILGYKFDESMIASEDESDHPDIIFKANNADNIYNFVTDKTSTLAAYELITDDVDNKTAYAVLKDYIKSLYGLDKDKLDYYSDVNNAIDFNIFVNLSQNIDIPRGLDGMVKNTYITFKWDNDHYRAILTPWDFDMALGTNCLTGYPYDFTDDMNVLLYTDYVAAMRRIGDIEIYKTLAYRYETLRKSVLSPSSINSLLDDIEKKVFNSGAFVRESERWPNTNLEDPSIKLSDFRDFISRRLAYLDRYYSIYDSDLQEQSDLYSIPNYVQVYLSTGVLLSPDDPEYYEAAKPETEEGIEEDIEEYTEEEYLYY